MYTGPLLDPFSTLTVFPYFLCFNIQELIACFQGSLYMFSRHDTLRNLSILTFILKFFSFSYMNYIASGPVLVSVQSGPSLTCY